jgi:uncharacterized iron-regulated membrane protein
VKVKSTSETVKSWIGKIHLWLGLGSGIIVFIMAVTGCIYAFQAEIQDMIQPYRFVEVQQVPVLPPSKLKAIAEAQLPGKHVHAVMYNESGRAAQVFFYNFEPYYYYAVYLNPYTGQVQATVDEAHTFFGFILDGHFYLWLPNEIGQPVVATATLVFVAMLITGLILWWPKNRKASKQRFSIKWSSVRWRRRNYDLHNVLGFYSMVIGLVLGLTGLVWGFQWFANSLYWVAGGDKSREYVEPKSDSTFVSTATTLPMDRVWDLMRKEYPHADGIEVHTAETAGGPIAANANPAGGTYWQLDYRYFDQYSLKELSVDHMYGRFADASAADKLLRMNYDVHTGAIIGLPGKIIAFLASLIIASLPITGFLIWKGRRDKEKGKQRTSAKGKSTSSKTQKATKGKRVREKQAEPVLAISATSHPAPSDTFPS